MHSRFGDDITHMWSLNMRLKHGWVIHLQVQMKPAAGRLQMDLPLAQAGPNVDPNAQPSMQMKLLRLVSSPAALPTSFAVGGASVMCGRLNCT